jgi:poly(A) polymerase
VKQNIVIDAQFLHDKSNQQVMAALNAKAADCARYVGGCVRDAILGRKSLDIDIATWLLPDQIIEALEIAQIKWLPTGIEHGTISAIIRGRAIEITTLRQDTITDGRHAQITFTQDWVLDAERRDFTCNSLYCNSAGQVFEPIDGAVDDCKNGLIRFVGDAELRVKEDFLRILRFFRFYAWLGKGTIDRQGLMACAKFKANLGILSRERIWAEFTKLLSAPKADISVKQMWRIGVLEQLMGFEIDVSHLDNLITIENNLNLPPDPIRRLLSFLCVGVDVSQLASQFRMSNKEKARILAWCIVSPKLASNLSPKELMANIYYEGKPACSDALLIAWARSDAKMYGSWQSMWDILTSFVAPTFPITGSDLKEMGVDEGPELGKLFKKLESYWVDNDFKPSKTDLLALI